MARRADEENDMKSVVFWTAMISVVSGLALQFPSLAAALMPTEPSGMLMHLFGCMAMFLGVMLIICSRDLTTRAPLVMWEGVLRVAGFGVMAGYGLWGGGGASLIGSGLFDLIVALIYFVGLPRHTGMSAIDLLLDRRAPVAA